VIPQRDDPDILQADTDKVNKEIQRLIDKADGLVEELKSLVVAMSVDE
jgi:hypothetical protein